MIYRFFERFNAGGGCEDAPSDRGTGAMGRGGSGSRSQRARFVCGAWAARCAALRPRAHWWGRHQCLRGARCQRPVAHVAAGGPTGLVSDPARAGWAGAARWVRSGSDRLGRGPEAELARRRGLRLRTRGRGLGLRTTRGGRGREGACAGGHGRYRSGVDRHALQHPGGPGHRTRRQSAGRQHRARRPSGRISRGAAGAASSRPWRHLQVDRTEPDDHQDRAAAVGLEDRVDARLQAGRDQGLHARDRQLLVLRDRAGRSPWSRSCRPSPGRSPPAVN